MRLTDNQGVRIHFDLDGQGPPLVCMHGFSGNRTSWDNFVALLCQDYRLILIDARGRYYPYLSWIIPARVDEHTLMALERT